MGFSRFTGTIFSLIEPKKMGCMLTCATGSDHNLDETRGTFYLNVEAHLRTEPVKQKAINGRSRPSSTNIEIIQFWNSRMQ